MFLVSSLLSWEGSHGSHRDHQRSECIVRGCTGGDRKRMFAPGRNSNSLISCCPHNKFDAHPEAFRSCFYCGSVRNNIYNLEFKENVD